MNQKEEILKATLELVSENGIGNISLSLIAKKVGIQKASLYRHSSSKEEIMNSLYEYLREKAKTTIEVHAIDYGKLKKNWTLIPYCIKLYRIISTSQRIKI